ALYAPRVGGGPVVDGAHVDEGAGAVDDEHVGRGPGVVEPAELALGVEQHRRRPGVAAGGEPVGFRSLDIALLTRAGGDHGEPDGARGGGGGLQGLHVAGGVVLRRVGALVVGPLDDDGPAPVCGQRVLCALGVGGGEI